ncbi:acylneuraminate cytidylyltransferase family protein [Bradyrhizobium sediminis]|uniref:Acylneuraminate cytidylyltransferase family protein n=1 Tax=Bradyrhizobium sediminis TaxID=2840469 RepID=A0A975NN68_9BRAD|nr:acylneuraminate cytidylyltransferase family protein [Bradyrhizobium sediminis]QWG17059.1 acylneuraminate cytidylyltransferase family protein [Bradyrhizobium sediminis]
MKVLGLIPARGGSKGIPRKNIKVIAGKPLIAWTIETALKSTLLAAVVVSTDDQEIGEAARRYGAKIPFVRPAELAQDDTPGVAPVLHALDALPEFDAVLLMQPTSPLRTTEDIDECIRFAEATDAGCVVSVTESGQHPQWMYRLDAEQRLQPLIAAKHVTRRQDLPPVYAANGALYFARREWLQRQRTFITTETLGYVMPIERSVDLDSALDWKLAELLLKERA